MRKPFIAVALAIASALTASVSAQTPAASAVPVPTEVSGTVLSTGNIMMLVRGDDGQDRSLVLFDTTQMPAERIEAGERVKVRYRPIDGDRFEAVSIEPEATAAAPGTPAAAGQAESTGFSLPGMAAISSLAWLVLALGVTIFVAAYLVSVRRHHHHHMH